MLSHDYKNYLSGIDFYIPRTKSVALLHSRSSRKKFLLIHFLNLSIYLEQNSSRFQCSTIDTLISLINKNVLDSQFFIGTYGLTVTAAVCSLSLHKLDALF